MRSRGIVASQFAVSLIALSAASGRAFATELPPFKLGLMTQVVATGFQLTPKPANGTQLSYRPAQSNYAGVILGYRWIGGTVSFAVPAGRTVRDVEGTSEYQDYRLSFYTHRFGIEGGYNFYKGYLIDNSSSLSAATLAGQTFYKLPDLKTWGFGANFIYVVNPGQYSLPAALDQSEIEDHSGASWILVGTFRQQAIENPSAMIPAEKQSAYGNDGPLETVRADDLAAGGGFALNWVPSIFFVAPLAAVSAGYQYIDEDHSDGVHHHDSFGVNLHVRLGTGLNFRNFFLGARLYADIFGLQTSTLQISDNVYGVTLAAGVRF